MSWNIAYNKLTEFVVLDAVLVLSELQLLLIFLSQQLFF